MKMHTLSVLETWESFMIVLLLTISHIQLARSSKRGRNGPMNMLHKLVQTSMPTNTSLFEQTTNLEIYANIE